MLISATAYLGIRKPFLGEAMTDQELTDRQQHVLRFIEQQIHHFGYPPTIREIGRHLGIRSTNGVNDHLKALLRKGYLTKHGQKSRTLRVVRAGRAFDGNTPQDAAAPGAFSRPAQPGIVSVPFFDDLNLLKPFFSSKDARQTLELSAHLLGAHAGASLFATRYWSDESSDEGFLSQDVLLFRSSAEPESGESILVYHEESLHLRRYFSEGETLRLQPHNARQEAILILKSEFHSTRILGVLVGLVRVF